MNLEVDQQPVMLEEKRGEVGVFGGLEQEVLQGQMKKQL